MMAMMALGFGEIFGAYIMGRIVDKFGLKDASIANMVLILIAVITVLIYIHRNEYGSLAYFMAFIWGF